MHQRRNYQSRLLRLIKFRVSLKHSITKANELFYTGAVVATNRLGGKIDKVAGRKESMWIEELRKDLSQLETSKDKDIVIGKDQKENIALE